MLVAVLHFIHGEGAAEAVVRALLDRLAPGSFLVASNATKDFATPMGETVYQAMMASGKLDMWLRSQAEFAQVFDGLGHVPHEEDPVRTVAAVQAFLGD